MSIFHRLKQRKLFQWALAYLAGAWLVLQAVNLIGPQFGWPAGLLKAITILLAFGLVVTLILAWYHGERGLQRASGIEVLMLAALLVAAGGTLAVVRGGAGVRPAWPESDASTAASLAWLGTNRTTTRLTAGEGLEAQPAWSPDGQSLAYVSEQSGNRDIWIRSMDGGEETRLTDDPAEDATPAWSTDGRRVAFVSSRGHAERLDQSAQFGYQLGGGIWIAPAHGGAAVEAVEGGFNPSWSPDGRLVFDASLDGPRRIWYSAADGSARVRVSTDASDGAAHTRPRWSPDGRWIVYERREGSAGGASASDIQLVSAEGGEAQWITRDEERDFTPSWLNERVIVFASDRGGAINLWAIEIDPANGKTRGEPVVLTTGAGVDIDPAASPDGQSLAFSSLRFFENLWSVAMEPPSSRVVGEPRPILESTWSDFVPALSPDGSTVVFTSARSGDQELWVVPVEGGEPRRLTSAPGHEIQTDWSPDGRAIAFFSDREGNNDIWVISASGGTPVRLTDDPGEDINPYWSPDGTRIAFMSDRSGRSEVWVMGADGSAPRKMTDVGATAHDARWSPDGTWILFTSMAGGHRDLWAVPAEGGEARRLTTTPSQDAHGVWSHDGKRVLYLADHRQLWSVPIDGGPPTQLWDPGQRIDSIHLSRDGRLLLFTFQRVDGDLWRMDGFR